MPSVRQIRGHQAEDAAVSFLQQKGMAILDRHVTSRYGEIDILAEDGDTIVAVEVKYRQTSVFGTAAEAVTKSKVERLTATLEDLIIKRNWQGRPYRIDVVTIEPAGLRHIVGVANE